MDILNYSFGLAGVTVIGAISGIVGYFLMRQKFLVQLKLGKQHEEELAQKVYEIAILKEIGDRIGYSLDAAKIVEIISGSLGQLLPFSTVSHIIADEGQEKLIFSCNVKQSVSTAFIQDVKVKMLAAISTMRNEAIVATDVEDSISGSILDDTNGDMVNSFFNLPIIISGKLAGLISVSSIEPNLYNEVNTAVLYRIAKQASDAVSKLQDVLENEKSRLSQAVESLSDGLMMVDYKYRLAIVNRKLSILLGTSENPTIFDIVNALSGQLDLRTKMEEATQAEEPLPVVEITVKDKVLQVVASKVMDRRGERSMGVVVLFHDVTDAKSLERLRNDFMSMMVHELRAPLTSIKSTVELLKSGGAKTKEEDLNKYLGVIDSTSLTMLELVNDLLDVAKLEAGKFDIVSEEGSVAEVVRERVDGFSTMAATKGLKITAECTDNLPDAYLDKIRIKQVLNNLISNAIKYTETGEIKVKAMVESINGHPEDILVAVVDSGIGIEPDQVEKLFSKFGQLEAGRKQAGLKSSGLGLFIAKSIVEASGGKIGVKSDGAGMGSTFYFTLPLADSGRPKENKIDTTGPKMYTVN